MEPVGLWSITLLMLVAASASAEVSASSSAYLLVPLGTDGGGNVAASPAYMQSAGSFGGIAETIATAAAYNGRHAYVAALPEPGTVRFTVVRTIITRRDRGTKLFIERDNDEDSPIAVPYTTTGGTFAPGDALLPGNGEVVFADVTATSVPLALALNCHEDDGIDTSFDVHLGLPSGEMTLGTQRASRIFVTAQIRDDGRTRPLITTTPPVLAASGDHWEYPLVVDVRGLQLPHSLQTQFALDWAVVTAEPGVHVERVSATTARVIWEAASGRNDHHSVRIHVVDHFTGLADWQEALIYVARSPQGDG